MSLNKVIIIGRLGADPEIRRTQSGDPIASLRVATSESWRDRSSGEKKEKTEWHSIVIFGALASIAEKYLKKGSQAYFEGKLQTRKWQDQSGNDRYSTEVILSGFGDSLVLLGGGERQHGSNDYGGQTEDSRQSFANDLDDDIPFILWGDRSPRTMMV